MCSHCGKVRDHISSFGEGYLYGGLYEQLSDLSYPEWKDNFLMTGMRRKWKKKNGTMWKTPNF